MPVASVPVAAPSRRAALKTLALGGAGLTLAPLARANPAPDPDGFTFAHLTDMHVRRKRRGHEGYAACIDSVNALQPMPAFVLMGGDMAFDGLYNEKSDFEDQIQLFKSQSDRLSMPWYPCIGNHDVLGWSARRKVPVTDPDIGKTMIMDRIGMERSYYSFDHGGWHFVVLDTIHPLETENGPAYTPSLGTAQLDWLRHDLGANAGKPTVVNMHIAAFCNLDQINGHTDGRASRHMVIQDGVAFRQIVERHGVKAVLQGHSHQVEDFYYNGVWYVTSQSVSAAWWGGNWRGFRPGYTVLHARPGGQLSWTRHEFEWSHHLEPEDTLERERIAEREAFETEQRRLYEAEIGLR